MAHSPSEVGIQAEREPLHVGALDGGADAVAAWAGLCAACVLPWAIHACGKPPARSLHLQVGVSCIHLAACSAFM